MNHELKIWPQYFEPVLEGRKTFEIQNNDRGYQAGDIVTLREWNPALLNADGLNMGGQYTGRMLEFRIGYVFPFEDGLAIFSLLPIEAE